MAKRIAAARCNINSFSRLSLLSEAEEKMTSNDNSDNASVESSSDLSHLYN